MRTTLLILAGLAALAFGLVARMPAAFVADWADSNIPGLTVSGASGTALDGRVQHVLYKGLPLKNVRWHIQPWSLLVGELQAEIRIATDTGGIQATISRSLFADGLTITDVHGSASLGWLAQRAGYTFIPISGRLSLDLKRVALTSAGQIKAVTGQATVSDVYWQLIRPPALLGRFSAKITSESGTVTVKITDSDGPLAVKGSAQLQPNNVYQLTVRLRPRTSADPRVKQLISELGNANANGWYRISTQGRL